MKEILISLYNQGLIQIVIKDHPSNIKPKNFIKIRDFVNSISESELSYTYGNIYSYFEDGVVFVNNERKDIPDSFYSTLSLLNRTDMPKQGVRLDYKQIIQYL